MKVLSFLKNIFEKRFKPKPQDESVSRAECIKRYTELREEELTYRFNQIRKELVIKIRKQNKENKENKVFQPTLFTYCDKERYAIRSAIIQAMFLAL